MGFYVRNGFVVRWGAGIKDLEAEVSELPVPEVPHWEGEEGSPLTAEVLAMLRN